MISCCMIAWNESKTIDLALKSIADFVDEVIIADNGSFDGTQEIARRVLKDLKLKGKVLDVEAKTLGQVRLAAWRECSGDWILLIDSNLIISDALKAELNKIQIRRKNIGCVQSLNLMGDYKHYFTPLQFHAHHTTFFNRDYVTWKNDDDRPVVNSNKALIKLKPWAVNLSRVRPAWRSWYRGEPFDPRFFKRKAFEGFRTETNRQNKWLTDKKYKSMVEYVEAQSGQTLEDVKKIAPEWYLSQLNQYAKPLQPKHLEALPEIIKTELENPRYKLIYNKESIVGRHPEL